RYLVRATQEPVSQPLIRHVSPHAVVRRRRDYPPGSALRKRNGATILTENVTFTSGNVSAEIVRGLPPHEIEEVHSRRFHPPLAPKADGVRWLRRVCAWHLI